jgi:hypothetical protein
MPDASNHYPSNRTGAENGSNPLGARIFKLAGRFQIMCDPLLNHYPGARPLSWCTSCLKPFAHHLSRRVPDPQSTSAPYFPVLKPSTIIPGAASPIQNHLTTPDLSTNQ